MTHWYLTAGAFISALAAIWGVLYTVRRNTAKEPFERLRSMLAEDRAVLHSEQNRNRDAFEILEPRFDAQCAAFEVAARAAWLTRRIRLNYRWRQYYGKDQDREWWPHEEYSAFANNMANTTENTKELASHRLSKIIGICR